MYKISIIVFLFYVFISQDALSANGKIRYLCKNEQGTKYFTLQPNSSVCSMLFLDESWENIIFSDKIIVDYNPYDVVSEEGKVKVWSQQLLSEPNILWDGSSKYDHLKTLNEFYCGKRQVFTHRIIPSLAGKFIATESSIYRYRSDIDPQTIDDTLYKKVCEKANTTNMPTKIVEFDDLIPEKNAELSSNSKIESAGARSLIWIFIILQILAIKVNLWVYNAYIMQPKHNHPAIFWNPFARELLLRIPLLATFGLVVGAFIFTDYGWQFLLFTVILWLWMGYRSYKSFLEQGK
jgi:hypothetical protein